MMTWQITIIRFVLEYLFSGSFWFVRIELLHISINVQNLYNVYLAVQLLPLEDNLVLVRILCSLVLAYVCYKCKNLAWFTDYITSLVDFLLSQRVAICRLDSFVSRLHVLVSCCDINDLFPSNRFACRIPVDRLKLFPAIIYSWFGGICARGGIDRCFGCFRFVYYTDFFIGSKLRGAKGAFPLNWPSQDGLW